MRSRWTNVVAWILVPAYPVIAMFRILGIVLRHWHRELVAWFEEAER